MGSFTYSWGYQTAEHTEYVRIFSVFLLQDGKELAEKEGGQFTAQRSTRLTARLPARCESSATYTCTTGDADQPLRADVTLDVLCKYMHVHV